MSVSDMLKEKADPLFNPGKCQLTIQIKREILNDVKDELPSSNFTALFENPNQPSKIIEKAPQHGKIGMREDPSDIDVIQRKTLALAATGTDSAFP